MYFVGFVALRLKVDAVKWFNNVLIARCCSYLSCKGPVIIYQLGGGGAGQFFGKPVISSSIPPAKFLFRSRPPLQQQTVCNADPPNGPSPLLSQQIITLEIPNGFQNVIKHKTDKKDETMILLNQERKKKKKKKKIDSLFSKIVNQL